MNRLTLETKVGILFLVCLAILAYTWFRVVPSEMKTGYELKAQFRSVEGLQQGSQVQVAGIKVGRVKEITFDPETGKALVTMDIRKDYENSITEGSRVMLKTKGLLGERYIVIAPGKPNQRKYKSGEEIKLVSEAPDAEKVIETIGVASQDIQVLARTAREEFVDQKGAAKVTETITDSGQFFKDMREIVSNNKQRINDTLKRLDTTSENVEELVARNREKINVTVDKIESFSRGINQTGDKLKKLASDWDSLTLEVRSGKGTLGKLITEEGLHQDARALVRDLRQVTNQVRYGQGTISRLINDPEMYYEARRAVRNMNKTAEDVSEATPVSTLAIILGSVFR